MQGTIANLSPDFLFPKLHGIWARAFFGMALQRLAQSGNAEAVGRLLAPLGIEVARRDDVQGQLIRRQVAELASVRRLADPRTASYYAAFLDRHFYADLKTILHYRAFPEREVAIEYLLVGAAGLPRLDPGALLSARTPAQFVARLPEHPCRAALLAPLMDAEVSRDPAATDARLDRLFHGSLVAAAKRLPRGTRALGSRLVRTEIDIANISMAMRNLRLYRFPADVLHGRCLPDGLYLDEALLAALVQSRDLPTLVAHLPPPYRSFLEPLVEKELHLSEKALWGHLYQLAARGFADYNRPADSLVAFPYLKHFETLNLGRVCEGVHFGLPAAGIQELMIGADHV